MGDGQRGWQRRFREQGYRVTGPRLVILEILAAARRHLSAKEVYTRVVERDPSIGSATIYRTLDLLASMGLVKKNDFGEGFFRYELEHADAEEGHVHLICEYCGRPLDVEIDTDVAESINHLSDTLLRNHRFELNIDRVNLFGVCGNCKNRDLR